MKKFIDCLFIGYNECVFEEYEKRLRLMGKKTIDYKDINMNFIQYNSKLYTPSDIFNLFYDYSKDSLGPLSMTDTFSLTIAYLGSFLHNKGFNFDYIQSYQNEKDRLIDILRNQNILAVAISTTYYTSIFPILEITSFIKEYNASVKIIAGGPFIANCAALGNESVLNNLYKTVNADFYIYDSQGEQALSQILYALKNNTSFSGINNISYRENNKYHTTLCNPEKNILEENPIDWSLFSDRIDKLVSIRTSVSCPFKCSFCEYPRRAGKFQTASIEYIEKQLNSIYDTGKVKNIGFTDDTFNVPPERIKNILRMMIRNKYGFRWYSYFRCQFADEEMLELMKKSGCDGAVLGIESGNQKILNNMNKAVTVEQYKKGMALLKEYEITTEASFIIGFVGETYETFKQTVEFIEETAPDFYRPYVWYCSPLSPIWDEREKYGVKGKGLNWSHFTMDSQTAADLMFEMFLSIKNSILIPHYNFNFPAVVSMLTRGIKIHNIKGFINAFNGAVKEKLIIPDKKELGNDILDKLKNTCTKQ